MAEPSLIPKTGQDRYAARTESMGIFMVLGVLIFCVSIAALIGIIFYKQFLVGAIDKTTQESRRLEAEFSQSAVQEWARTAESIEIAKEVLTQHRYLSNVFTFLEQNTLPEVRFSRFAYDATTNKVTLGVGAKSFDAVAQQKEIFSRDPAVSQLGIGSFNLTSTGGVEYEMDLTFNSTVLTSR